MPSGCRTPLRAHSSKPRTEVGAIVTPRADVTLQINLAPTDLRHAAEILPHELRQFGDQVGEIVLVLDVHHNPMVAQACWERGKRGLEKLAQTWQQRYPHLRMVEADTSPEVAGQVAGMFSGGQPIPQRDWRGAPIYAYFYGLWAAQNDYVLHMDSDMLYGGGSQTWVAEAVSLLRSRPDVLVCSPLPGPPTADGRLTVQTLQHEPLDSLAYRAEQVSTRVFLIDRSRFCADVGSVVVVPPPSRRTAWMARFDGYPPYQCAEVILSTALTRSGLIRIDFLGSEPGMWSLHPPHRSELFYDRLPGLIASIEAGDVTEAQRGNYDIDDSMMDWSTARKPRWQRLVRHAELAARSHLLGAGVRARARRRTMVASRAS